MFDNLVDLQQQLNHKVLTLKDIAESPAKCDPPRNMNADEIAAFDRIEDDIGKLKGQIAEKQATNRRLDQMAKLIEDIERPAGRITAPDQPAIVDAAPTTKVFRVPATARRSGVLKAFKPRLGESQADCDLRAYRAGMWARATVFKSERAAQWCMTNGLGVDIRNAMGTTSNPDGGFLVPDELSMSIIDLRETYGIFRQNCRVWPMGSDTLMIPRRSGGVTIAAIGENPSSAISQSNPTFDMVTLVAKKFGGLTLLSSEVAEDAVIDLADWIASEFAYGFANFEDTAGFTGDGTSTYGGIRGLTNLLTEASGLAGAKLATAGDDTFPEILLEDLNNLMGLLPAYARAGAKWYISALGADALFGRFAAAAGGNTVQTFRDGLGLSFLGYPVVISQVLYSSTSAQTDGSAMLFFGDLSKSSALGDRRTVRIFPSEHRYMDTDQIGIRGIERIDIVNHDIGTTTTPGPIVALLANAS